MRLSRWLVSAALLLLVDPIASDSLAYDPDLAARVYALETQNVALRGELHWLQQQSVQQSAVQPAANVVPLASPLDTEGSVQVDYRWAEPAPVVPRSAWTTGNFRIVPYGILWTDIAYDSRRINPGAFPLWVHSPDVQGEDAFSVNMRSTRLGLDLVGPRVPCFVCATSGGKVEVDFYGTNLLRTENRTGFMLRHAYWEVKDESFRFLAGQTWDIVSPLNPGTLHYPVAWTAGNIGYRRAQLRLERYIPLSDRTLLTLQGSLNDQVFSDSIAGVAGETSDWPVLQGRIGMTLGHGTRWCGPITFGISGHIGEQQFDSVAPAAVVLDDARRSTWSFNADLRVPINDWLGVQGELFTGENLGTFLGGIGQGIDPGTLDTIGSSGGWFEMWVDWTSRWHTHVGFAVDNPDDADVTTAAGRTRNSVVFGNLSFDATEKLLLGIELSEWRTEYAGRSTGESVRTEFVAKYGF